MIMHNFCELTFALHQKMHYSTHYSVIAKPTTQIQEFFNEIMAWQLKKSKDIFNFASCSFL